MLPEGVSPNPPIKPAHMSERISPYRLGMTITRSAKGFGFCVIFPNGACQSQSRRERKTQFTWRQTLSRRSSPYVISGNSLATSRHADRNMPSDIFLVILSHSLMTSRLRPYAHNIRLVNGRNSIPSTCLSVMECVACDTLRRVPRNEFDRLHNAVDHLYDVAIRTKRTFHAVR
jgi:hypothetical protein